MLRFLNSLFGRVMIALVIGVVVGALFPHFGQSLRPLGDGFLKLIKMVIAPIVFCVVVSGMASAGDLKKVGRVGLKAVIYFEIMTTLALVIGAILAWVTRPGVGMNIDLHTLNAASLTTYTEHAKSLKDTAGFLLKIIPTPRSMPSRKATFFRCSCSRSCLARRSRCSARRRSA